MAATCALLLLTSGVAPSERTDGPSYELRLDERDPTRINFELTLAGSREERLSVAEAAEPLMTSAPTCGTRRLTRLSVGTWLRPADCAVVSWSARLADADADGMDASSPMAAWSGSHRLWLVTSTLPWLRLDRQAAGLVSIRTRLGGRSHTQFATLPADPSVPVAIPIGTPSRRYVADGFTMHVYGAAPTGARVDRLQRLVASTWARWRRDVVPPRAKRQQQLSVMWMRAPAHWEPGYFASAASDAILMQYVPDPQSPNPMAKLEAGILLIGAHEGFHALSVVRGAPAWVNESLASFFAYEAARSHLSGASLALATELISTPAATPILQVEREVAKGDQSNYSVLYGKGARFWAAIDAVLDVPANQSGRLASLIQTTDGLRGLEWSDPDQIAAYLDARSQGRAGPIVRCYLVAVGCRSE